MLPTRDAIGVKRPLEQKHYKARTPKPFVRRVPVPAARNSIDEVVNSLIIAWNGQARDECALTFFGADFLGERQNLILQSVCRWESEEHRRFVAAWLRVLADAIYGGVMPWKS